MALTLKSSAFAAEKAIPKQYTEDGANDSPELEWSSPPEGTQSYAMIMDDPDAPPGTWVHWVLYDLPSSVQSLKTGLEKTETLANGAKQGLVWGVKEGEFNRVGYNGPAPPPGSPHRYFFKLYALDTMLNLALKLNKFELESAMQGHILAEAVLMGTYER